MPRIKKFRTRDTLRSGNISLAQHYEEHQYKAVRSNDPRLQGGTDVSDDTPQNLGVADPGVDALASRADHVHDMPKLDDVDAPDDNSDLNATVAAHGLLPKLSGRESDVLNGEGDWVHSFNFFRNHTWRCPDTTDAWSPMRGGSTDISAGSVTTFHEAGGLYRKWTTGASTNDHAGLQTSGTPGFTRPNRNPILHIKMRTGSSVANYRQFNGWAYGDITDGYGSGGYYAIGFVIDSGDLIAYTANNAALGGNTIAAVLTDTVYYLTIDASTYTADGTVRFYVNGTLGASRSGSSISATQDLDPQHMGKTLTNAAKHFYIGVQHHESE